jgi:outer membrane protein assembly factor BamB
MRWDVALFVAVLLTWLLPCNATAADWSHWRGPNRNGMTTESSGWEDGVWPLDKPAWKINVGRGSTSPLIAAGRLYTVGSSGKQDTVQCLDAVTGRLLWKQSYACPLYGRRSAGDKGIYAGICSTPELDEATGLLYTLSIDGDLNCWNTRRGGKKVWGLNLYDEYRAPQRAKVGRSPIRDYGYTSSPLLHGDWLLVEVGAAAGNLIALDKRTGQQRWASVAKDAAGHNAGPVPITVEGTPCVAVHTFEGLLVVRLDEGHAGETVATHAWKTTFANNIASVAVHEDSVVITSAYNHVKIARLKITLAGAKKLWEQDYASKVCTPVIHDGHVYWAWRNLWCLDFETGKLRWQGSGFGDAGSCIVTADDRLIVWANRGDLVLAETAGRSPDRYRPLATKKGIFARDAWPHVALAAGWLYCKDRDGNLVCFDLRKASPRK